MGLGVVGGEGVWEIIVGDGGGDILLETGVGEKWKLWEGGPGRGNDWIIKNKNNKKLTTKQVNINFVACEDILFILLEEAKVKELMITRMPLLFGLIWEIKKKAMQGNSSEISKIY